MSGDHTIEWISRLLNRAAKYAYLAAPARTSIPAR